MKFILGKKIEMTQAYRSDGSAVPATLVAVEPCVVTQIKTVARDGYSAVQIGCRPAKRIAKPQAGHLKTLGKLATLREFRLTAKDAEVLHVGDRITVAAFAAGDTVKVTGTSKGRGFQGVVKRHGFKGQPATHGHKDQFRHPGSSGPGGWQHVRKGKRFPGRMGSDRVAIKNLEVVAVDAAQNTMLVKGAIPGSRNGLVLIQGEGEIKVEKNVQTSTATGVLASEREAK